MNLPESINYSEPLPVLPSETKRISVSTAPSNGSSFTENSQINIDLVSRGFLDVDSVYITYDYALTSAVGAEMKGCPAYTPFIRLDTQIGSQTVDTIQNYNSLMNVLTNATMSVSQKYGQQFALGYLNDTSVPSVEQLDGRVMTLNESGSFSAPLMSVLTNADKMIPLFAMPAVRLVLTMDSIANIFTSAVTPTGFTISNVQLHYNVVDFGSEVEAMVRGMGEKLQIKSQSFGVSQQTLTSGSNATQTLIFNQRYASIKSLIALNGTSTALGNGAFDSVNLASNSSYYFNVAGENFPSRPITTQNNRAGALQELRKAFGSIYAHDNSQSINSVEFGYDATTATTTVSAPGKFYVGTSTQLLDSESIFTGVSSENSPISYVVNLGGATASNSVITLIVNYDAIIEVDLVSQVVNIKK